MQTFVLLLSQYYVLRFIYVHICKPILFILFLMLFFIAGDNLLFSYLHQETTIFSKFLFLYRVLH